MSWHADHGFSVAIAGGSIGGLCAGIVLRQIGAKVNIFERVAGAMQTRGAGIVVQDELLRLLRDHGAPPLPVTSCRGRRYLGPDGGNGAYQAMAQQFTSWEAVYNTLRSAFPDDCYHAGKEITDVVRNDAGVSATLHDGSIVQSDLLVAADGANSAIRQRLLPDVGANYAGYVAWRGTLEESETPAELLKFFDDTFTFSEARGGGHILAYFIPGDGADTRPGHRRLNWVWYVRVDRGDLPEVLTDVNGRQHRASLPAGLAPVAAVSGLQARARREVHPMLAALVAATRDPFVQTVVDVSVAMTRFGQVMLAGDAAFVVRPHTAGATAKAAYDALVLGQALALAGEDVDAGLRSAERLQIHYGANLVRHGVLLGSRWADKP